MKKHEWAKEFEKKEEERKNNPGTSYFRSYYNGYGLIEKDSGDGLVRNEFVYSGLLYCFDGTATQRRCLKAFHVASLAIAIGMLILCGAQQGDLNGTKLFAVPFFACALITVIKAFSVFFYILSPMKMREWDYVRAVKRYRILSFVSALGGAGGLLITLLLGITLRDLGGSFFLTLISFAIFAAVAVPVRFFEREDRYLVRSAAETDYN